MTTQEQALQSANIHATVQLASERMPRIRAWQMHEAIVEAIRSVQGADELRATIRAIIEVSLGVVE